MELVKETIGMLAAVLGTTGERGELFVSEMGLYYFLRCFWEDYTGLKRVRRNGLSWKIEFAEECVLYPRIPWLVLCA